MPEQDTSKLAPELAAIDAMMGDDAMFNTPVQEEEDELNASYEDAEVADFMRMMDEATLGSQVETGEPVDVEGVLNPKKESEGNKIPYLGPAIDFAIDTARTVGDVATQGLAGVDDAVRNTLDLIPGVQSATQWLSDTFGDGDYDPGIAEAKTLPGALTREVTKFMTGYIPLVNRLKKAGLLAQAGTKMRMSQEAILGAVTEFIVRAPDEKRFSDMLIEIGVPDNIVTDWLKSDPNDSEIMGRVKNSVEGLLGSTVGEGVVKIAQLTKRIAKHVKQHRGLKEAVETQIEFDEKTGKIIEQTVKRYGTPSGELVEKVAAGQKSAARTAAGKKASARAATKDITPEAVVSSKALKLGDSDIYVNYGVMEKPEDVRKVIQFVTDNTPDLVKAKQGSISQKLQKQMAETHGITEQELLTRKNGEVWNTTKVLAARAVWENAAENLELAAKVAAEPTATQADHYVYRKLLSTFGAINAEIRGASAEASRSFRAWGLGVGDLSDKARRVSDLLAEHGGPDATRMQAERVLALARQGLLKTKAGTQFLERSVFAKGVDGVREAWVAGMLWLPSTHIVNGTSAIMVLMHQLTNRKVASVLSDSVHADEAAFALHGMMGSIKDAFRYAGKAFKSGESGYWANKAETTRQPSFTAEAFGANSESMVGKTVDALGSFLRTPLRVLGATDEFSKTIAYRGELHALALRDATNRGLTGDAMKQAIAQTLENPPKRLQIQAMDAATYATFQDKGGQITQFLARIRNDPTTNVAFRFGLTMILPFVKTPARILNYSMEHSPFAVMQKNFWADVGGGDPARRAIAMAKLATGTSAMAIAFDWADSGVITGYGPRDKAERDIWLQNNQPYSIRVGDKWYSFNRMDPIGMMFGFAADMADIAHRYELGDSDMDELGELTAGVTLSAANVLINKNYMQGLARTINAVTDPERYGKWWLGSNIATFVPFTTLAGATARASDDQNIRQTHTIQDFIDSRLFWRVKNLTPLRDIWGRNVNKQSGLGGFYDFISPLAAKPAHEEPINAEIRKLAHDPLRGDAAVPRKIGKNTTFMGVRVDLSKWPDVFDEYTKRAGGTVDMTDKPLLETMNDMVQGKGFYGTTYELAEGPYQKLELISGIIEMQRQQAQYEIISDPKFADFAEWLEQMRENSGKIKMGDPTAEETIPTP